MDDLIKALKALVDSGIKVTFEKSDTKPARTVVACKYCTWKKDYSRADNAEKALKKHLSNCQKKKEVLNRPPQWLIDQSKGENNGH